jgi:hypothetical protein
MPNKQLRKRRVPGILFLAKRLKDIIFTNVVLVGKNIRERQQKYDTKLTNTVIKENFFNLIPLAFQSIRTLV